MILLHSLESQARHRHVERHLINHVLSGPLEIDLLHWDFLSPRW